jgi:hypothetical protein
MKLAEISVRRPVFAIMMTAATLVVGAASYKDLGLDLMPKTDAAVVTVTVTLPGASAEEVETQVTKRIEEAVNTVSGIDELRATSEQGASRVTITFTLERDIESATQDVRDKVATVVALFPRDAKPPVIQKVDPDSQPILSVSAAGPRSPRELTEIADKKVKQVLETLPDVGLGHAGGGDASGEFICCWTAAGSTPTASPWTRCARPWLRQNVEIPGQQLRRRILRGGAAHHGPHRMTSDDFNRHRHRPATTVGRDLRRHRPRRGHRAGSTHATRLNGTPVVNMQVRKQSGANTVEVVDRVLAAVKVIATRPCRPTSASASAPISPVHPPVVRGDPSAPRARQHPGQRGGLRVHAQLAGHRHCRPHRADLDSGRVCPDAGVRIHPQQHDDAGAVAGHGHRHRRRHRRHREHFPLHGRGGDAAARGRRGGHGGDRHGGDGDDTVAGRDLRARRVHDGTDWPLLLQLRDYRGRGHPGVDVRFIHADAGLVRGVAAAG